MDDSRTAFAKPLLRWYEENHRDLPWRHTRDPYAVWISEIMLQQTRVEAVRGYYERFLKALPTVEALAECPDDVLMKLWQGLGYYSRARNLKKAAERIVRERGGSFPDTCEDIRDLPGIGSYTAGAVASIAFGIREPAVDGNVLRVMARYTGSDENILRASYKRQVEDLLRDVMARELREGEAGNFNQSLIELGALVCVPGGTPCCEKCPIGGGCRAKAEGSTSRLPVRDKDKGRRKVKRTVLLVRDGDRTAIRKRPPRGLLAGMYEFPSLEGEAVKEEILTYIRKMGAEPLRIREIVRAGHLFSHVEWSMTGYEILIAPAEGNCGDWIFATKEEIEEKYAVPSAYAAYLNYLLGR